MLFLSRSFFQPFPICRFGFVGGATTSTQFVIEEITGVIRLHSKPILLERDKYELNVTAVDDGSCCVDGGKTIHTSTAVVVVFITDVNDNKPVFKDCSKYTPKISEGTGNGHEVIKVSVLLRKRIPLVVSPRDDF